jgi:hypothetical protein
MTKATRSRKAKNVNLEAEVTLPVSVPVADGSILDDLLDQLEAVEGDASIEDIGGNAAEVLEEIIDDGAVQAGAAVGAHDAVGDLLLDDIVADAERQQAKKELYASQESSANAPDGSAPETTPESVTGKKKGKGKKKAAAPAVSTEPEAPAAPKTPRATSVTHKPGDLLKLKLGAKANEFLVFSLNDATTLEQADLEMKAQAFVDRMNDREAIADKVREKIIMLFTWMQKGGGADALNEVMRRAFTVLHEQGELTSGDKGNLQLNLLAKPYSVGTARSQANQMFMAFPELGLVVKEKGRMVANADSALLPVINQMLGFL